ncbi:hypothetical protein M1271_06125 [Patescibacteria group bacterium]|nr:hypothetical protein [Patescibacteria group bacterium]MCL5797884.1 hypothetical protein [Patescibacteria group bacterium]
MKDKKAEKKDNASRDFAGLEPTKEEFENTLKNVSKKIKPSAPSPSKPKT